MGYYETFGLGNCRIPRQEKAEPAKQKKPMQDLTIAPFTIAVDTREQLPYSFDGFDWIIRTDLRGLKSGDYSIIGMEDRVAIERKSLQDCFGSMTWGRDRFEREIIRLNEMEFAVVVIEASWYQLEHPEEVVSNWGNRTKPETILGTITAWSQRYRNVHWWAIGDRRECEKQVFRTLKRFWDDVQEGKR